MKIEHTHKHIQRERERERERETEREREQLTGTLKLILPDSQLGHSDDVHDSLTPATDTTQ